MAKMDAACITSLSLDPQLRARENRVSAQTTLAADAYGVSSYEADARRMNILAARWLQFLAPCRRGSAPWHSSHHANAKSEKFLSRKKQRSRGPG
jgi:hypothetical protein